MTAAGIRGSQRTAEHPSAGWRCGLVLYIKPQCRDARQDPELAYVMLRYRQTHDLTHLLLAQPTSLVGEVLVKWVEAIQNRLPM